MLEEYKAFSCLTEKELEWVTQRREFFDNDIIKCLKAAAKTKKEGGACFNAKRVEVLLDKIKMLENPAKSLKDEPGMIAWTEERSLGAAISFSKVDSYDSSEANTTCFEFVNGKKGDYLTFGVVIESAREVKIKKGDNAGKSMLYLTISDNTCSLSDVCVFPETLDKYAEFLIEGNAVLLKGYRDKKKSSLVVKEVSQI
jgi:DNA polymerase III alpha subunit